MLSLTRAEFHQKCLCVISWKVCLTKALWLILKEPFSVCSAQLLPEAGARMKSVMRLAGDQPASDRIFQIIARILLFAFCSFNFNRFLIF